MDRVGAIGVDQPAAQSGGLEGGELGLGMLVD
jgi:hypothetical protein